MKLVNGTCISTGKFPAGKQDYLFKVPPIPGNFSVGRTENAWARIRNFLVALAANTYNRINQSLKAKCRLNIQWTIQNLNLNIPCDNFDNSYFRTVFSISPWLPSQAQTINSSVKIYSRWYNTTFNFRYVFKMSFKCQVSSQVSSFS